MTFAKLVSVLGSLCVLASLSHAQPLNPRLRCGVQDTLFYRTVVADRGTWSGEHVRQYVHGRFPMGMSENEAVAQARALRLRCELRRWSQPDQVIGATSRALCLLSDLRWPCTFWNPHAAMAPGVDLYFRDARLIESNETWSY